MRVTIRSRHTEHVLIKHSNIKCSVFETKIAAYIKLVRLGSNLTVK